MKKQMLIAHNFPPIANAESVVTANMVRALEQWGWESVVCTVRPERVPGTKDMDLMDLLPRGLEIHRSVSLPGDKATRLMRILGLKRMDFLARSLPDESIFWYPSGLLLLHKMLHRVKCSLVHTRSVPITDHLLGLYAKRSLGLPWVAHFSDPWIDSPLYTSLWPSLKKLHTNWERKIIKTADAVIFTTEETCRLVMAKYPEKWGEKCHVISHGFELFSFGSEKRELLDPRYLNILHLGSFYGKRTPISLFQALKEYLQKFDENPPLRVWLIGRMPRESYAEKVRSYGLETIVRLKDAVPYKKGFAYAREADVLLVIDIKSQDRNVFLQSKLIEYLGMKKTIWGVVSIPGISANLLKSAGCPVADMRSPVHIAESLGELVEKWQNGKLSLPEVEKPEIKKYSLTNTSKKLASVLNEMI